jgi:hypothetical protein
VQRVCYDSVQLLVCLTATAAVVNPATARRLLNLLLHPAPPSLPYHREAVIMMRKLSISLVVVFLSRSSSEAATGKQVGGGVGATCASQDSTALQGIKQLWWSP